MMELRWNCQDWYFFSITARGYHEIQSINRKIGQKGVESIFELIAQIVNLTVNNPLLHASLKNSYVR